MVFKPPPSVGNLANNPHNSDSAMLPPDPKASTKLRSRSISLTKFLFNKSDSHDDAPIANTCGTNVARATADGDPDANLVAGSDHLSTSVIPDETQKGAEDRRGSVVKLMSFLRLSNLTVSSVEKKSEVGTNESPQTKDTPQAAHQSQYSSQSSKDLSSKQSSLNSQVDASNIGEDGDNNLAPPNVTKMKRFRMRRTTVSSPGTASSPSTASPEASQPSQMTPCEHC